MVTQKQMALKLGVSPQFISRWKKGQSGISVKTALKWSKILGVEFKLLMTATPKQRIKILGLKK